ncbi:Ctr86 protein [Martiniozyma asiatica (nom. inval.)]|nr:Ctr86 protein [Martiniozyma asiatica]
MSLQLLDICKAALDPVEADNIKWRHLLSQIISSDNSIQIYEESLPIILETLSEIKSSPTASQSRLLKGLILLSRNILCSLRQSREINLQFKKAFHQISSLETTDQFSVSLVATATQSIMNFPDLLDFEPIDIQYDLNAFKVLSQIVRDSGLDHISVPSLEQRLQVYLCDHEELRVDIFYHGKDQVSSILMELLIAAELSPHIHPDDILNDPNPKVVQTRNLLINIFSRLLTHESFGAIVILLEKNDLSLSFIYLCQLICATATEHITDPLEMISLASWCLDYYKLISEKCKFMLQQNLNLKEEQKTLQNLHRKLIAILDIIADIIAHEIVLKTLNEYQFLPSLIELFHIVEKYTVRTKLKNTTEELDNLTPGSLIDNGKKHFPGVKSIILELITSLVHHNKGNQNIVRENHGLELVLNNCNLDAYEPFIRERGILCIKYLLENNIENQNFIAQLEAKGVNEESIEAVEKAGYEVDIVDGKVKLKKGEKIQEIEEKIK